MKCSCVFSCTVLLCICTTVHVMVIYASGHYANLKSLYFITFVDSLQILLVFCNKYIKFEKEK